MAEFVFWFSLSFITYTYAGYPALLFVWSHLFQKPIRKAYITPEPMVSVVIAAHNEEKDIKARIENLVQQDYPCDKLELIIISDGSTDNTVRIVRSLMAEYRGIPERPALELIEVPENRGKPNALNLGVSKAKGEYIVFADARQKFNDVAIKELIANFSDPEVGCVSGELAFIERGDSPVKKEMGFYWTIEKRIRLMESAIHSVPGATGAIYAIRSELYATVPVETLLDDVFIPLLIVLKGYRSIFDGSAVAIDIYSNSFSQEKKRKIRTSVGNYQLLTLIPAALSPGRNSIFLQYWSHKVFRLIVPFIFLAILITSILFEGITFRIFLVGTFAGSILAIPGKHVENISLIRFLNTLSKTFFIMNYFALLAFWEWFRPEKKLKW